MAQARHEAELELGELRSKLKMLNMELTLAKAQNERLNQLELKALEPPSDEQLLATVAQKYEA